MKDPRERFSSRVDNYVRYRPSYPPQVIELLQRECGLTADSIIADIGSGTGILTELFLRNGNTVYGVEPNREMREAGERLLDRYPPFHSVNGSAEATGLADDSVDFVTAGQAFHWFDADKAHAEFDRILRPGGWVALIWNSRRTDTTPFLRDYETLLRTLAPDYSKTTHTRLENERFEQFFGSNDIKVAEFENHQYFDFEGVKGRVFSSSYTPEAGDPAHELMVRKLHEIFENNQQGGQVSFDYDTRVYYGRLTSSK